MINLKFFPSRQIALYVARLFFTRSFAVLGGLVVILMTLDLLGTSSQILAHPGNGDAELWRYVGLRVPQLITRFLPFAVLLGTLITLVGLNQHSEIITMKAAGISAHQIIAPLIIAGLLVAIVNFGFNERVTTRASAALSAWEAVDYGAIPPATRVHSNVWVQNGDDLILARRVSGGGGQVRLDGVTLYDRTGGTLHRIVDGRSGLWRGGELVLGDATEFLVDTGQQRHADRISLGRAIRPNEFTLASADPDEQDFPQLRQSIVALENAGRPTASLRAGLWHKLSGPLSTVLMPLLAAVAAFGLARSGQLFVRAVIGMALGFAYFVADNFALAMGNFGAYPPFLAAWGPFLLFLLVGETVLIRTEE
ncbi:LPS export ABC transporter permease LptG [Sphingosinicella ginsenosidimutans]|uniref:LPS export ABC transporter permease LptG n=1 Tax=Allosphingosinicella ginsenosidimutans TaxID=1176539 RepID=UPI003386E4C7